MCAAAFGVVAMVVLLAHPGRMMTAASAPFAHDTAGLSFKPGGAVLPRPAAGE
jgi:hypothetical protein